MRMAQGPQPSGGPSNAGSNVTGWIRVLGSCVLLALGTGAWLFASDRYAEGTAARFVEPTAESNFALAPGGVAGEAVRACDLAILDTYDPNLGITQINLRFNFRIQTTDPNQPRDIGLFVNGGLLPREDFTLTEGGQPVGAPEFRRTPITLAGHFEAQGSSQVSGEILNLRIAPSDAINFTSPYLSGEIRRSLDAEGFDEVHFRAVLTDIRSTFAVRHGPRLTMALPKFLGVVGDNGTHSGTSDCGNQYWADPPVHPGSVSSLKLIANDARHLGTRRTSVGSPYAVDDDKDPTLSPRYRLDLAVPATERGGQELTWQGPDAAAPEVSILSRDAEVDAEDGLFVAGIAFTAAVAFGIFAVQLFPWIALLHWAGARILARRR